MRTVVVVLGLAACGPTTPDDDDTDDTDVVPACPQAGAVDVLAADVANGTEGLTIAPDGTVWVVGDSALWRLDAEGAVRVADAPRGVGAAWWRGSVWVALWEDFAGEPAGGILEVPPSGEPVLHPTPTIAKPNFLTPAPWGELLVSDDFDTRIFAWDEGEVRVWAEDVPSPNGMGFAPGDDALWVASTFTEPGLSRIPVTDGAAGAVERVVDFDAGSTPDGLAVAADGSVLVALNLAGRIVAWDGERVVDVASDLPTPASVAFGRGPIDPCTVVVTGLFDSDVRTVATAFRGYAPAWADAPAP